MKEIKRIITTTQEFVEDGDPIPNPIPVPIPEPNPLPFPLPVPSNLFDTAVNGLLMEGYTDSSNPFVTSLQGLLDDAIGMPPQLTPTGFNRLNCCFRWLGCLIVPADGLYEFRFACYPAGSLEFDGDEVFSEVDPQSNNAWYVKTFTKQLVKGKLYPVEAINVGKTFGGLGLELRWRCKELGIIGTVTDPADPNYLLQYGYDAISSKRWSPPLNWRNRLKKLVPPNDPNALVQILQPNWATYQNPNRPVNLYPSDNWWNTKIVNRGVDSLSPAIINRLGNVPFHPVFGAEGIGMPTNTIADDEAMEWVKPTFLYPNESDPGPYPISKINPIALENGGSTDGADCHYVVFYKGVCYEIYQFYRHQDGTYQGDAGRIWAMNENRILPDGETSADAAGMSIAGGLVTFDELENGVNHALRLTVKQTRDCWVAPASHKASNSPSVDIDLPPMGTLLQLDPAFDISSFPNHIQNLLIALQKYGGYIVDNGSNFIGITGVTDSRFSNDELVGSLRKITSNSLRVVTLGTIKGLPQ